MSDFFEKNGVDRALKPKPKSEPKQIHFAFIILIDVILIGISLCVFALFHHVLPSNNYNDKEVNGGFDFDFPEITDATSHISDTEPSSVIENTTQTEATGSQTEPDKTQVESTGSQTEPDKTQVESTGTQTEPTKTQYEPTQTEKDDSDFTSGEIISNETTYKSKNVSVALNTFLEGGHEIFVIDIKVKSMKNFLTAIAPDSIKDEYVHKLAKQNNAVCAINGDYFGLVNGGSAIRNGQILSTGADHDVCVIYRDGRMEIFSPDSFDEQEALNDGAWNAWDFGPSLLDDNGNAIKSFKRNDIDGSHPRTAIGYYAPGHYCFVTIGGRNKGHSDGITLEALAKFFEKIGCEKAYNLDGGKSAVMVFGDKVVNEEYNGTGRKNTDIIYIRDSED